MRKVSTVSLLFGLDQKKQRAVVNMHVQIRKWGEREGGKGSICRFAIHHFTVRTPVEINAEE